jgi:hypothetical protein
MERSLKADNLVVKGMVGGVPANILLDTGAEANLIGQGMIEKLRITKETCRIDRTIVFGAQSDVELKTLGVTDKEVRFDGKNSRFCRSIEFIATPAYGGDVIIGAPTLRNWGVAMNLDIHGSVITMKGWPGEQLQEALLTSYAQRTYGDSKSFHNLRVEKKRVWGMQIVDVVPVPMVKTIRDFYSKIAKYQFESVEPLGKDVVPTLNRLVAMRPTIVYMRFVKKSQLYHMLDLTIAHPLIFEIREKMIGIASLVATPEKARTWRRNMRERKLLEPDRFWPDRCGSELCSGALEVTRVE